MPCVLKSLQHFPIDLPIGPAGHIHGAAIFANPLQQKPHNRVHGPHQPWRSVLHLLGPDRTGHLSDIFEHQAIQLPWPAEAPLGNVHVVIPGEPADVQPEDPRSNRLGKDNGSPPFLADPEFFHEDLPASGAGSHLVRTPCCGNRHIVLVFGKDQVELMHCDRFIQADLDKGRIDGRSADERFRLSVEDFRSYAHIEIRMS